MLHVLDTELTQGMIAQPVAPVQFDPTMTYRGYTMRPHGQRWTCGPLQAATIADLKDLIDSFLWGAA